MNSAQKIIFNLVEDRSEKDLEEVIDFVSWLKTKREGELYSELQVASESSLDFWNNDVDDKVWNNV